MQNELCFVQFIHPGKEHRPDTDGFKDWNKRAHKRKFVEIEGRCVRKEKEHEGPVRFWAEWEPQSQVIDKIAEPLPGGPRFVYRPYYVVPSSYRGRQNTDPFVFDSFLYAGCQQWTTKGPTQLRYLERGSVILFGSYVTERFALDTVFVVADWVDNDASDFKKLLWNCVPEGYRDVALAAWYQQDKDKSRCANSTPHRSFRLYWGATIQNSIEGMYSFFPCRPAALSPSGFARPVIAIPSVITDGLFQGKRLNRGLTQAEVKELWISVRKQVESANLWLGVHADMPERWNMAH